MPAITADQESFPQLTLENTVFLLTPFAEHLALGLLQQGAHVSTLVKHAKDQQRFFNIGPEIYTKLNYSSIEGKDVILVHCGMSPVVCGQTPNTPDEFKRTKLNVDSGYNYFWQALGNLLEHGPQKSVSAFLLYMPYERQHEIQETGECNVPEQHLRLLRDFYKVDNAFLLDPHFQYARFRDRWANQFINSAVEGMSDEPNYRVVSVDWSSSFMQCIDSIPYMREYWARRQLLDGQLRTATDEEVREALKQYTTPIPADSGSEARAGSAGLDKERTNQDTSIAIVTERALTVLESCRDKCAHVIDDIVAGGKTLLGAIKEVRKYSPESIVPFIPYPVENKESGFLFWRRDKGMPRITRAGYPLVVSNSIDWGHSYPKGVMVVPIEPLIVGSVVNPNAHRHFPAGMR